jgi:three-Cys-motif partner protein
MSLNTEEHQFGGDWTEDKLQRLEKYLTIYRNIFTQSKRANFFRTWYVDAFAGTGLRTSRTVDYGTISLLGDDLSQPNATRFRKGSARIALGLHNPFDRYLFIDKSRSHVAQLRSMLCNDFPGLLERCQVRQEDANLALCTWCQEVDWKRNPAVVFLDPYGMQVEWNTVEALAATNAIDLWYLFPLGVNRMLTRDGKIDAKWQGRLDTLFGTKVWRDYFYRSEVAQGFLGSVELLTRDTSVDNVQEFISSRLATCFAGVAKGLVLRNSRLSPVFSLCFAAANQKGAEIAVPIAEEILHGKRRVRKG